MSAHPEHCERCYWKGRALEAESALKRVATLADSAGDLDNGILVWDLRRALNGSDE